MAELPLTAAELAGTLAIPLYPDMIMDLVSFSVENLSVAFT